MTRIKLTPEELPKRVLKRVRLPPKWPGVFENYSRAWVNRQFWRVRNVFDSKEDALSGCAVTFSRCLKCYGDTVDNDKWFMALYKRALVNDWNTYSVRDGRHRNVVPHNFDTTTDDYALAHSQVDFNAGEALVRIRQAPKAVQAVLEVIAGADPDLTSYIFQGEADSVNRRLCELAGIREFDALTAIRVIFSEGACS